MHNLVDEARMLFHNLVDTIDRNMRASPTDPESAAPRSSGDPVQTVGESTASQSTFLHQRGNMPVQDSRPVVGFPSPVAASQPQNIAEVAAIFRKVIGTEYWKDIKYMFNAYLRMEDTGGQPDLMDMLPALTIGPALYLLFLNFQHELQSRYKVSYCSKECENSIPVESTYTVKEMFLSALSSISCSSTSSTSTISGTSSEGATNPELSKILESSKSVAYVVGTHKDKVSEQHIVDFDKELQKIIRSTDFFEKGIVQFCSEGKLVVAMDNMKAGTEEIDEIRKVLEKGMKKFKRLKIPAVWLLFSLCLRMRGVRTADLNTCLSLSRQFDMSLYETRVAL